MYTRDRGGSPAGALHPIVRDKMPVPYGIDNVRATNANITGRTSEIPWRYLRNAAYSSRGGKLH